MANSKISRDQLDEMIADFNMNPMLKMLLSSMLQNVPDEVVDEVGYDLSVCLRVLNDNTTTRLIIIKWQKRLNNGN